MKDEKNHFDVLIVGGGVFGLTAALELTRRSYQVALFESGEIPNPLASSTDISKIVRMEYGSDELYFAMAQESLTEWKRWNEDSELKLYYETGFLMLTQNLFSDHTQKYEQDSLNVLQKNAYKLDCLNSNQLQVRFPVFNSTYFKAAHFNNFGGYVRSSLVLLYLKNKLIELGGQIFENSKIENLVLKGETVEGVKCINSKTYHGDKTIVATGAHSVLLKIGLEHIINITGHPVYWLKPNGIKEFSAESMPVFTADISNTGWYGFPYNPFVDAIKIARHAKGEEVNPAEDIPQVNQKEISSLNSFLNQCIPSLANAKIIKTRRCLYSDTKDGDFLISKHPSINNLIVSTGGSGHAMKMAPLLGKMTADTLEDRENKYSDRFKWRSFDNGFNKKEQARNDG